MTKLGNDVRQAMRVAMHQKSVTAMAIVAFALGIGVTTAVFSIFNGVLLAPFPFPDPEQIVAVFDTQPACATCPASFPKYHDWKDRNRVFSAIGGSTQTFFVMTTTGQPEQLIGASTTASLNDVFRVRPRLGRWYSPEEDRPGAPKVVVLSHKFWMRGFNGDRALLGRRLTLNGEPYDVIGVMPESFTHRNADVYVPLARQLDPATRGSHFLTIYARLQPGVTLERATADMRALGQTLAKEFGHNHGIDVKSYYELIVGNIRGSLQVLLGAVLMVLLIACANVANLLLAAGFARRRELGIRMALGAGRGDLARQLTCEGLLLAVVGGALGLLLAVGTVRVFVALATDILPRAATIQVDGRVLAFTAAISVAVGILCGLWPLLRLRVSTLTTTLREGDVRTSSGTTGFGNGLVVAETALAFALLVGAGLMVKNLVLLERRDAGIRTDHVITFDLTLSGPRYKEPAAIKELYRSVYDRLKQVGGVQAVGLGSHLPMYRFGNNGEMTREGGNPWGPNENPLVEYRYLHGDYLKALGIPLLRGRLLDDRDRQGTNGVLINQAMADKFWPGQDPIGRHFGQGQFTPKAASDGSWNEVVGVVGNVRSFGLTRPTPYEFYRTTDQVPFQAMTVVIRTSTIDPATLIPTARSIVTSLDPQLPVTRVQTMVDVVSASVGQPRLLSALTMVFGGLAGLLAMVGIYGVTSYNVWRQRHEHGIRLALGANPGIVQRLIIARGARSAVAGIAIGIAGALLLTRTLQTMLNDVRPTDPTVYAINAALILTVSLLACYAPARWAGKVDPASVLRM
jgi:putative ABC transport system permease protein